MHLVLAAALGSVNAHPGGAGLEVTKGSGRAAESRHRVAEPESLKEDQKRGIGEGTGQLQQRLGVSEMQVPRDDHQGQQQWGGASGA